MLEYGQGVGLRRLEKRDLAKLFEWRNDKEIMKWTRQCAPLHWANHESWFENQSQDPKISMFAILALWNKENGNDYEMVGVVGLTDIDLVNRRAEFSCYIAPDSQKKGFGKMALKTLFNYGFTVLGLNQIWGETFEGNPASKTFEEVGMTKHGTRPDFYFRDGKFISADLYGIGASAWKL